MKKVYFGVLGVVVGVAMMAFLQPVVSGDSIYEQFKKFQYVFNTSYKNYVEDVDSKEMMESAIIGMLDKLDVHSVYISEEEMKKVTEDFQGSFEGIGIEFDILKDTITVISPIAGGPSEEIGIQAGDKIIKIDNEDAIGLPRTDVPKKLKGPKGTIVEVDIKRGNKKDLIHYKITRDKIPLYSVDASYLIEDTDIGFISINRFAAKTYDELIEAVGKLKRKGMKKLILDLRFNPGGYLQQAFLIADAFLDAGNMIVYTKGRKTEFNEEYYSTGNGALKDIPLIVMINEGSASASEIVSGAVQDLDRGLVVGTTSFGKGLVQRQFPLGDGSAFRLTISKYYTPSGRLIQRPYKDKDKYRKLFGRIELEEGSNIEHALDGIRSSDGHDEELNLDSLPIFYTRGGRVVLGGGGITPDYVVKRDTNKLTTFTAIMRMNRVFYDFANQYLAGDGKVLKTKYKDDFHRFIKDFEIDDKFLAKYKQFAIKNHEAEEKKAEEKKTKDETGSDVNDAETVTDIIEEDDNLTIDQQFDKDKDFIKIWLKSEIAKLIWGREEQRQVLSVIDRQLQKAITLFPEVEKITSLK